MGTGNYRPSDGRTVIASPFDSLPEYDETESYLWHEAADDLKAEIAACLSSAWWNEGNAWRGRDARILHRSRLHDLTLHQDSYDHFFITVRPRDDLDSAIEPLAAGNLNRVADSIFRKLAAVMPLRVASSAWTSSPYQVAA